MMAAKIPLAEEKTCFAPQAVLEADFARFRGTRFKSESGRFKAAKAEICVPQMVQQGDANVGGAVYQDLMAKIEQSVNAGNDRRVLLDRIFFEVLNEPEFDNAQQWAAVQTQAIAAIRRAAPYHTIIATAERYSGLTNLLTLEPVADPNVIYTFHDYEPFAFTHQGATWTMEQVRPLRRVPYPSSPEDIAAVVSQEQQLIDQHWINSYGLDRWDAARIRSELSFAGKWAALHHVPVYCGEFGVYQAFADPAMRAAWLHDTRMALEEQGIGWAVWDYRGSFAVVSKTNGKATPIPAIATALGLHSQ